MSKLWAWVLGLVVLVAIGFLVACGSTYNSSHDGLVLITSQGSALIETFSFSLQSGHAAAIQNSPNDTANKTCVLNAIPSSIVVDPAGAFAYTILTANTACNTTNSTSMTGIATFKVNSDGTMTAVGQLTPLLSATVGICPGGPNSIPVQESGVAVNPSRLVMDSAGKFLFVADNATVDSNGIPAPGAVTVFVIGSGGSLTEVAGSPFTVPASCAAQPNNLGSLAVTPTVLPPSLFGQAQSVCSAPNTPPVSEYLYAADSVNNGVWEFTVNTSTGVLGNPPSSSSPQFFATGSTPMGVAVDPCDRFVYVSNSISNNVSAYNICTATSSATQPQCPGDTGKLVPVSGSPFAVSNGAQGPGPLVVDPYGNYVYVLDTLSNTISPFRISPVSGALTIMNPATVATGQGAKSIAIRSDDNWMFVTDYIAATVSQFAIAPATGALSPQAPITTDNYPWGVAVK